jgi:HPt (histidine-containing phosphotransfer) domain-containing protein
MNTLTLSIDKDLEDIVPVFLQNRHKYIETITTYLEEKKYLDIEIIGHKMAGNSGGYGFEALGEIGRNLETSARNHDENGIRNCQKQIEEYLSRIEIIYK